MISISPGGVDRLGLETPPDLSTGISSPRRRRRRLASSLVVVLVAVICVTSVFGVIDTNAKQDVQTDMMQEVRDARVMQQALGDAESAVRGFLLAHRPTDLQSYYAAVGVLQTTARPMIATLDAFDTGHLPGDAKPISTRINLEIQLWDQVISTAGQPASNAAITLLDTSEDQSVMRVLRGTVADFIDGRMAAWQSREDALDLEQDLLLIANAGGGVVTILALIYALIRGNRETDQRELAMAEALHSREQAIAGREEVRQIFAMAEALQSASGLPDGAAILRACASRLLPALGGALYIFNSGRDRLDLVVAWDAASGSISRPAPAMQPFLIPGECWALKRNKPHLNAQTADALRCCHAPLGAASLEVPMVGRGEAVGLLVLHGNQPDAADCLLRARDIASVLADSMSLALSSIMLREKLRNQAVRDSLTGLYNRRFLEEVLQKLCLQAQRRHASLAAIMIDLDHFKRLNDEYGHAMGDTVLKAAAAVLLGALRASDIACRYGGEELVVLMPDCTIEMARAKAEQIRERIARLSRQNGPQVSASLGVSAMPSTARDSDDLLSTADTAMYVAKQQGRNRVGTAAPQAAAPDDGRDRLEWRGAITLVPLGHGVLAEAAETMSSEAG